MEDCWTSSGAAATAAASHSLDFNFLLSKFDSIFVHWWLTTGGHVSPLQIHFTDEGDFFAAPTYFIAITIFIMSMRSLANDKRRPTTDIIFVARCRFRLFGCALNTQFCRVFLFLGDAPQEVLCNRIQHIELMPSSTIGWLGGWRWRWKIVREKEKSACINSIFVSNQLFRFCWHYCVLVLLLVILGRCCAYPEERRTKTGECIIIIVIIIIGYNRIVY